MVYYNYIQDMGNNLIDYDKEIHKFGLGIALLDKKYKTISSVHFNIIKNRLNLFFN